MSEEQTEKPTLKLKRVESATPVAPDGQNSAMDSAKKAETVRLKVVRTSTPTPEAASPIPPSANKLTLKKPVPETTPAPAPAPAPEPASTPATAEEPQKPMTFPAAGDRSPLRFKAKEETPEPPQTDAADVQPDTDVDDFPSESEAGVNEAEDASSDEEDDEESLGLIEGVASIIAFLAVGFSTYQMVMDFLSIQ